MLSHNRLKQTLLGTLAVSTLVWAMGTGPANAAPIFSVSDFLLSGQNESSDVDREYLIDRNFNGSNAGQLDVGDSLRGLFTFNKLNDGSSNLGRGTSGNEFTGLFQSRLVSKTITPAVGGGFDVTMVFGPDPLFAASICGGVVGCVLGANPPLVPGVGALFVFFDDPSQDAVVNFTDRPPAASPPADVCAGPVGCTAAERADGPFDDGTLPPRTILPPSSADVSTGPYVTEEAFVGTARNGTHFWTLGFTGPTVAGFVTPGAGEGWVYNNTNTAFTDNILGAFLFTPGAVAGGADVCVSVLDEGPAGPGASSGMEVTKTQPCSLDAMLSDVTLHVDVGGVRGLDTPFEASSLTRMSFALTPVPEPATLSIFGVGLLGLAFVSRRRNKKQAAA